MKDYRRNRCTDSQKAARPVALEDLPTKLNFAFGSAAGLGGSERRMLDVVRELRLRGILVRVMSPGPNQGPLAAAMAEAGAQIITYGHPAHLVRLAAGERADATWAFGARAAYPLAIGRRLPAWQGGHLLVAKNGLEALRSRPSMLLERLLIRSADLVVANSQAAADQALTKSRARAERIRILRSALSVEWMTSKERSARTLVRIAMIGNARPEKEHALGMSAFRHLNDPETCLTVLTNDSTNLRVQLANMPSHIGERVAIREGVTVTPEIMRSVDVLLHPSSSESMPRVALEARAQGAWVVGFDVGDLAQYCRKQVHWGDEGGLVASLRDACGSVRVGDWPAPIDVLSVSNYIDQLARMICELSGSTRGGTPSCKL